MISHWYSFRYGPNISLIHLGDNGYPISTINETISEMNVQEEKREEIIENETQKNITTRKKPLEQAFIDEYIQRYKHKVERFYKYSIPIFMPQFCEISLFSYSVIEFLIHFLISSMMQWKSIDVLNETMKVGATEQICVSLRCSLTAQ